ncbi:DUF4179 domain-containing protein [Cytobacillus oceanisediminis]|uniref:DUF4179 domain-containing protein n=1 Tax=Cytobacillus oceanisediminis TaxID=665099 RepID=UPI00203B9F60|nr:DUF4179 domain-containing protein [Cytobacillus oceanisediminis]MCM3244956.1 DUF4179 domain-containing protein [Cytobacillus oceanisediminis]
MTKRRSLKKAFIKKYGEDLIFTDKEIKEVMHKIHNQKTVSKRNFTLFPVFMLVITPVVAIVLLLSSTQLISNIKQEASKETEVSEPSNESELVPFGDIGIQKVKREGMFTSIEQTVEKHGIAITLHELMYDGTRLSFIYSMDKKNIPEDRSNPNVPNFKMNVDGRLFADYSMVESIAGEDGKILHELHLYEELPDQFQLEIIVGEVGKYEGPWEFKLPVTKKDNNAHFAYPDKTATNGELSITLDKMSFAASSTNLEISMSQPLESYKKGNGSTSYLFEILDDKGQPIAHMTSGATGGGEREGKFVDEFNEYFEPVSKLPKSITIIPYIESNGDLEFFDTPLNQNLPLYLEQDSYGGIAITEIEQKKGEIWIHYQVEGVTENRRRVLELKEKGTDTKFMRYDRYQITPDGYIAKFKTTLPLEELVVSTWKRTIKRVEGLDLKVNVNNNGE